MISQIFHLVESVQSLAIITKIMEMQIARQNHRNLYYQKTLIIFSVSQIFQNDMYIEIMFTCNYLN